MESDKDKLCTSYAIGLVSIRESKHVLNNYYQSCSVKFLAKSNRKISCTFTQPKISSHQNIKSEITAAVLSHEVGHIFGIRHDEGHV